MTRRLLPVLAFALAVAGCGYALSGKQNNLPDYIRRIGIPVFQNKSAIPELDQVYTQAVRNELQSRGKFTVVGESTGVDAILTGTIQSVSQRPVVITTGNLQASRYVITVTVHVEFALGHGEVMGLVMAALHHDVQEPEAPNFESGLRVGACNE